MAKPALRTGPLEARPREAPSPGASHHPAGSLPREAPPIGTRPRDVPSASHQPACTDLQEKLSPWEASPTTVSLPFLQSFGAVLGTRERGVGAEHGDGLLLAAVLGAAGRGVRDGPAPGPRAERGGAWGARLALLRCPGAFRAGKPCRLANCLGSAHGRKFGNLLMSREARGRPLCRG